MQQLEAENQALRDETEQLRRRVADLEEQLGQGGTGGSEPDTKSGHEPYTRHDQEQEESEVAESSSEDELTPKLEDPVPPAPSEPTNGFAPPLERRRSSGGGFQRAVAGLTALLSVSARARLALKWGRPNLLGIVQSGSPRATPPAQDEDGDSEMTGQQRRSPLELPTPKLIFGNLLRRRIPGFDRAMSRSRSPPKDTVVGIGSFGKTRY